MPDPVQLAKEARQKLAAALSALQQEGVPDDLVEAAEPIAQAMGVLHRIERSNGQNLEGRKEAVDAVRSALGRVQAIESSHPAVDIVMESIAGSLSRVHALLRIEDPKAAVPAPAAAAAPAPAQAPATQALPPQVSTMRPAPQPAPVAVAGAPVAITQPKPAPQAARVAPIATPQGTVIQPRAVAAAPVAAAPIAPAAFPPPVQPAEPAPGAAPKAPSYATLPITDVKSVGPAFSDNTRRETPPVLSPQLIQAARSSAAEILAKAEPARAPAATAPLAAAPPPPAASAKAAAGGARVDVELGTHSTSNFYKGLGGNDVIEHGGIFIATYKSLPLNSTVTLRVLLPGDYEFTAQATVQWTREAGSSEPGYGARFTQISADGRQLVYRYTRNREPMFYDDL